MTDHDKIQRGIDAKRLLEEPLIVEAFARMEVAVVNDLAIIDVTNIAVMAAKVQRLQVIRGITTELRSMSLNGQAVQRRVTEAAEQE